MESFRSVILNLFQDPNTLYVRPRNKFGVTGILEILTFLSRLLFPLFLKTF